MLSSDTIKSVGLVGGYFLSILAVVVLALVSHSESTIHDAEGVLRDIAVGSAIAIGAVHLGSNIASSVSGRSTPDANSTPAVPNPATGGSGSGV